MEMAIISKVKRGLIRKTWERCRSIRRNSKSSTHGIHFTPDSNSKSWPSSPISPEREDKHKVKRRIVPQGCFSVYVGPEKQKFLIRTDCINHPLFKILLEEAELEYGYCREGPLKLPCNVDIFYNILSEIDGDSVHQGCNFAKGYYGSYHLLSPSRLVATGPLSM